MLVRPAVSVVGDGGVSGDLGMEVSRLFRSFGSSGADNPPSEQHAALIDEAAELELGPVRGKYRARHAQPEDDVDDSQDAVEDLLRRAAGERVWALLHPQVEPPVRVDLAVSYRRSGAQKRDSCGR